MYDNFDALIFDMDGTLVDSGQLHEQAWIAMMNRYAIPIDRHYMRSLAGVPTLKTIELLLEKYQLTLDVSLAEMHHCKENFVNDNMHYFVKPTALLDVVKQYHGKKPMAVGTGALTAEADTILQLCGLAQYFHHVVGADRIKNPKPAPDTFLYCAELLNVEPQACVVFEDSRYGLQAAASAGMTAVDVLAVHNIQNNYFL